MSYDYENNGHTMTATLPGKLVHNGKWPDKKEQVAAYKVLAIWHNDAKDSLEIREPVTARLWMARAASASVCYATIWIGGHANDTEVSLAGHGSAGGWGYHRNSAALQFAIESAGIKLDQRIDGVGDTAIEAALLAIARAVYPGSHVTLHFIKL